MRQGLDKNFFFALIPFTLFLFNWLLKTQWKREKNWRHLKDLSIHYFFLHPIFIELSFFLLKSQQLTKWENGRLGLPSDDYPDPSDVRISDSMAREENHIER